MRFTVIYVDCTLIGSHMNTITKLKYANKKGKETVSQMLERLGLETSVVFVFAGWLESLPDF